MFIEDHGDETNDAAIPDGELPTSVLLAACAQEAERQAVAMRQLDAALGTALALTLRPAGSSLDVSALISALTADLQQADRVRQETEGLARALALAMRRTLAGGVVRAEEIRDCTPLIALQRRLSAPLPSTSQGD